LAKKYSAIPKHAKYEGTNIFWIDEEKTTNQMEASSGNELKRETSKLTKMQTT